MTTRTLNRFVTAITEPGQHTEHRKWREERATPDQLYRHAIAMCMVEAGHIPPRFMTDRRGNRIALWHPPECIDWTGEQSQAWHHALTQALSLCEGLEP